MPKKEPEKRVDIPKANSADVEQIRQTDIVQKKQVDTSETKYIDVQQILAQIIFYISIVAYGVVTSFVYDPSVVGYTISLWFVIIWRTGLGIWEYIGRKYEVLS